jgi:hypothetical protein
LYCPDPSRIADQHFVGDFQHDIAPVHQIVGTIDVGHPALRHVLADLKPIELIADLQHAVDYSIAALFCCSLDVS